MERFREESVCPICIDTMVKAFIVVPCGHSFCWVCLDKHMITKRQPGTKCMCPYCKTAVENYGPNLMVDGMISAMMRACVFTKEEQEAYQDRLDNGEDRPVEATEDEDDKANEDVDTAMPEAAEEEETAAEPDEAYSSDNEDSDDDDGEDDDEMEAVTAVVFDDGVEEWKEEWEEEPPPNHDIPPPPRGPIGYSRGNPFVLDD
jgi:Ring finger domain